VPGTLLDWIALNLLPGFGPTSIRRALARFHDPGEIAYRVSPAVLAELLRRAGAGEAISEARRDLARRVERELATAERLGLALLVRGDPAYPAAFETLPDPPTLLYVKGALRQDAVRIAVVGARRATPYGRRVAAGLASGLAARGIEVVSGGARGIDTAAHVGALEEGGRTVVVLGSGFLHPYPPENAALFERAAAQGAVLTELTLEQRPKPESFPRRNRLISGLSAAVVVVEAGLKSGSLSTAEHALEQGREVMAVPGPVSSELSHRSFAFFQAPVFGQKAAPAVLLDRTPDARRPPAPAPHGSGAHPDGGRRARRRPQEHLPDLGGWRRVPPAAPPPGSAEVPRLRAATTDRGPAPDPA
jgi:DNA processing protein